MYTGSDYVAHRSVYYMGAYLVDGLPHASELAIQVATGEQVRGVNEFGVTLQIREHVITRIPWRQVIRFDYFASDPIGQDVPKGLS